MTNSAPSLTRPDQDVLHSYRAASTHGYDELIDGHGAVRAHWRTLIGGISELSGADRAARAGRLDRRVRETGIAYDIFADPNKTSQRWHLDLAPVVFSATEWRWLETSLVQRARLFDALLTDLYGERNLIRRGLVPADLAFSDSTFLRPCQDILPAAGGLRFYAADVARGADGLWRVIDNHTETLAGIGFALANRVVHTHVAGDLFKRCNGVRLASHFQAIQGSLIAHSGRDNARIALLTPGAHHQDYFSHAYLARYLGYLLVEGSDLRTRGGRVHLKTLEGLKGIDLIVRCVEGRSIDPLELDPGGFDGPPGLMRVCRRTPRLLVNAAGTALAQNRGLGPYLPALAKHLLGEELALWDAPRWWLGDPTARAHVLADREGLVVRKAQEGTGRPGQAAIGQDTRRLSAAQREVLGREIALHGAQLVAEAPIGFSSAPAFEQQRLVPRPFAARFFVALTDDGYRVMPGGLAMTVDPESAVALSAPEGQTRDVWVISDTVQEPHVSLWRPAVETARVQRSQRVIQSRVADDLFWLGRYAERADWTLRVLRSALRRVEEDSGPVLGRAAACKCIEVMLDKDLAGRMRARRREPNVEERCVALISDPEGTRTLKRTIEGLYRTANLVRDRLSLEAWLSLSRFRPGDTWATTISTGQPISMLDTIEEGLSSIAAFNGLMHENMTRNFGWSFLDMGRRLERAYNLSEAVLSLFVPPPVGEEESASLLMLLELADSFITYRSRYRLDPMAALVLDLLVLDETNPRSLAFQLTAISRHLDGLPDGRKGSTLTEDRRMILSLLTQVRLADIEAIAEEEDRGGLEQLMRSQVELLPDLSNAIARHYFNLTEDAPHRVHTRSGPRQ